MVQLYETADLNVQMHVLSYIKNELTGSASRIILIFNKYRSGSENDQQIRASKHHKLVSIVDKKDTIVKTILTLIYHITIYIFCLVSIMVAKLIHRLGQCKYSVDPATNFNCAFYSLSLGSPQFLL